MTRHREPDRQRGSKTDRHRDQMREWGERDKNIESNRLKARGQGRKDGDETARKETKRERDEKDTERETGKGQRERLCERDRATQRESKLRGLGCPELDVNSLKKKQAHEKAPAKNIKKPQKAE
ncbi:hypothetical protein FQN60_006789, partial [Etheostoma spectabile]